MFARWTQENFFRYLIYEFDFDKMIEYGTEQINENTLVPNPEYSKLSYNIKKLKEKKARVDARLFAYIEENLDTTLDAVSCIIEKHVKLKEKQFDISIQINNALKKRAKIPARITLKNMPENKRYNRLKKESKIFMNTIKMIAYRAETALFNTIKPFYKNTDKDGRQIIKDIFTADADLIPDYTNNTLTVVLHSLATPRANRVAENLCEILNQTETVFPNTNLTIIFKTLYPHFARDWES